MGPDGGVAGRCMKGRGCIEGKEGLEGRGWLHGSAWMALGGGSSPMSLRFNVIRFW